MNKQACIGVIDSGVGGLSILKQLQLQLPHEHFHYIADSQFAPYGEKSPAFILERLEYLIARLEGYGLKALVIACNTATVNAIDALRQQHKFPIIGVEPAIKPAAKISQTKHIGVLVTQATANNQRFLSLIAAHAQDCVVHIQPCAGLVNLIEQNQHNSSACTELLQNYLAFTQQYPVDTIVLGCTHYPFVQAMIAEITQDKITILETAEPVANQLQRQLIHHNLQANEQQQGRCYYHSTGDPALQQSLFSALLEQKVVVKSIS